MRTINCSSINALPKSTGPFQQGEKKCAGKQYRNAQMCVFMTNSKQLKNIKNYKVTNPKQQRELTTLH